MKGSRKGTAGFRLQAQQKKKKKKKKKKQHPPALRQAQDRQCWGLHKKQKQQPPA